MLATLLSGYIVAASLFLVERKQTAPCAGMQIVVRDSLDKHFVNEADLSQILRKAGLDPMKRNMDEINTEKIDVYEHNKKGKNNNAYCGADSSYHIITLLSPGEYVFISLPAVGIHNPSPPWY